MHPCLTPMLMGKLVDDAPSKNTSPWQSVVFPLKDCFCFYLDVFTDLVLSCLVSLECTLGGLFLAHAAAGLHCTVQSITPPWAGCSGHMHLNHLGACAAQTHVCPSSTI
jgi:hypothetical protein